MAETKTYPYTVKHVDGVMHLVLNAEPEAKSGTAQLRVLPPIIEAEDED